MSISRDEVRHVARLAHLDLNEDEIEAMTRDLAKVLEYVTRLQDLDPGDSGDGDPVMDRAALRPDRVEPGLAAEEAVSPAPIHENGLFKVPPAFGER